MFMQLKFVELTFYEVKKSLLCVRGVLNQFLNQKFMGFGLHSGYLEDGGTGSSHEEKASPGDRNVRRDAFSVERESLSFYGCAGDAPAY